MDVWVYVQWLSCTHTHTHTHTHTRTFPAGAKVTALCRKSSDELRALGDTVEVVEGLDVANNDAVCHPLGLCMGTNNGLFSAVVVHVY